MTRLLDRRSRFLATILALAAVAILVGLSVHAHDDDCHDFCWLCHSSLGSIGLPAVAFVVLIIWTLTYQNSEVLLALHDLGAHTHTAPRAPPC